MGISHLFFADDLMLFGEASEHQAKRIMDCLTRLGKVSRIKVNSSKSHIYCSLNTSTGLKRRIADVLGMPLSSTLDSYLGIPLLKKRVSKDMFNSIIDQMRRKTCQSGNLARLVWSGGES